MKKNLKKLLALTLALIMVAAMFTGCKQEQPADKTLVIGVPANFEEKWNPFMAESAYDQMIIEQVFVAPMKVVAGAVLEKFGGNIVAGDVAEDGSVTYTVTCNKDMKFTDGEKVTIDDYIYMFYVCSDQSYTGPSQMVANDIRGIKEYYYDDSNYTVNGATAEAEAEKYQLANISEEDFVTYMVATELDGQWDGDLEYWTEYISSEGLEDALAEIDATDADAVLELVAKVEYAYAEYYDAYSWWFNKIYDDIKDADATSQSVDKISGLERVDDYTCKVTFNSLNIYGDRAINLYFTPEHYYGAIEKGNVGSILANVAPLGSGPYVFGGFADNIVTCTANADYFEGVPKTGTVKWQYVPSTDTVTALANGEIDIAEVSSKPEYIEEMDSLGLEYDLVDNDGYGYVGLNCENLPLEVRQGLFCLMNREPSVNGYYKGLATVIERPMSTVIAEYPDDATVKYPYDPAEALKYFEKAGYSQVNGKLVDENGEQLVVNAYIAGEQIGDHPSYAMLVQASDDMKNLGGQLQVNDVDFNILQAAMNDGSADMFCLAWGAVYDCDKTTQFKSTGGQNRYKIKNAEMDALLDQIIVTIDLEERSALVAEMLDLAMDLAIEVPVYQRLNCIAYNSEAVNMDTVIEAVTFYNYTAALWKVEMN